MMKRDAKKNFTQEQWVFLKNVLDELGDCWSDDQEFFPVDQPTGFFYTPCAGPYKGKVVEGGEIPLTWGQFAHMGPDSWQEYRKLPNPT